LNLLEPNPDYYNAFKDGKEESTLRIFMRLTSINIRGDGRIVICDASRQRLQVDDKEKSYLEP